MIKEIAVVTIDSPYFREWGLATCRALNGRLPIVRATLDTGIDIGSPTLYVIIGDVDCGGIPQQVEQQLNEGRQRRAHLVLWYTERLPLPEITCEESDRRWERFQEAHWCYDHVFSVDAGMAQFMKSNGIEADHAPVGFDPIFDFALAPVDSLFDVLFNGEVNARRQEIIEGIEREGIGVHVGFGQWGIARAYAMARSRCYLNLHYDDYPMFEQLRFVHGAANKIPMISETVAYPEPFVPGEHFIMAAPSEVGMATRELLESPGAMLGTAQRAYEFVTQEMTMTRVVDAMLAACCINL